MDSTKILFVSQEITPYVPENQIAKIGRFLPQGIQEKGNEIRTFMPKFGCINERRNQLHEVIRLSGMNLIIDDTDHPLIIKVASIQAARMQVYFIDNEDLFQRKHILTDADGKYFNDNDERAIFFARGVLETVKKLRWVPDVVHCHGWFTSLVPFYLKTAFKEDPTFEQSKVVFSVYDNDFPDDLSENFKQKIWMNGVDEEETNHLDGMNHDKLVQLAVDYSDGVILGSEKVSEGVQAHLKTLSKPVLEYQNEETYVDAYNDFYEQLTSASVNA